MEQIITPETIETTQNVLSLLVDSGALEAVLVAFGMGGVAGGVALFRKVRQSKKRVD